jgi:hypothetical protein
MSCTKMAEEPNLDERTQSGILGRRVLFLHTKRHVSAVFPRAARYRAGNHAAGCRTDQLWPASRGHGAALLASAYKSLCIHSQLKSPSSSEVASMIEGVIRHCTEMEVDRNNMVLTLQSHAKPTRKPAPVKVSGSPPLSPAESPPMSNWSRS